MTLLLKRGELVLEQSAAREDLRVTPGTSTRESNPPRALTARELVTVTTSFIGFFIVYFSPVLFDGQLLAVGDATIQYLPMLLSKGSLWNSYQYAGHPAFADPQSLIFSPLRLAGGSYNAAVVSVYVLAATSAYCLVRQLTGLRVAGVLGGVVYGSGGAMMAHLGHLTIIYSAAFAPLIIWSVVVVRERPSTVGMTLGVVAIALSILGGHPQLFVYSMMLAGAYALYIIVSSPVVHRGPLVLRYTVLFCTGLAIACIQLIPLLEAGARSIREGYSFESFTSFSLSPRELLLFVFPRMMGGIGMGYFGQWGVTELTTYCGAATIMLAIAAVAARAREPQIWFWLGVLVIAIAYALGPSTPLARVVYHIPGLNHFRAPARAAFVTTLAFAVLAGFGYRALVEQRLRGVRRWRMWRRIVGLFVLAGLFLDLWYPGLALLAAGHGVQLPDMRRNHGVLIASVSIVLSATCISILVRKPSVVAAYALAIVLVLDLAASFGWYAEWRDGASKAVLALDKRWQNFAAEIRDSTRRVLFLNGINSSGVPAIPNSNLLYHLPSASAYGPLILKNYADAMGMNVLGALDSFDVLKERLQLAGAAWVIGGDDSDRPMKLGGDCTPAQPRNSVAVGFPSPVPATHLEIVSHLACSTQIEQETPVVRIDVRDSSGGGSDHYLVAGKDTAEWAMDRPDVAATIRHRRPAMFESFPSTGFNGEWFKTVVQLGNQGLPVQISAMTFDWLLSPGPAIGFRSIELVDTRSGRRRRVSSDDLLWGAMEVAEERFLPGSNWVRRVEGVGRVVWVVGETVPASDVQALDVIRHGRLPDGRPFDPYVTALVSPDNDARRNDGELRADARVLQWDDGLVRIHVQTSRNGFLVVAQTFYPGWTATVDGVATPIVQTNLAFQGIPVPAGQHTVVMSFMPDSLLLGIAAATLGIALLGAYLLAMHRAKRHAAADRFALVSRW